MTIGTPISEIALPANGTQTVWDFPFLIPFPADAVVSYVGPGSTTLVVVPATQYSITGTGVPSGGAVVYPLSGPPLAAGSYLFITRILPLVQTTSLQNQGPTFAAIETEFDYQMMCIQQLNTYIVGLAAEIGSLTSSTSGTVTTVVATWQLASVAALQAYTGSTANALSVLGYYTPGDNGGGIFSYTSSTASPNGGTIIIDGAGRVWNRDTGGAPYSVRWFGCTGNGVTDDTQTMTNCFGAMPAGIYVPSGTYRISAGMTALQPIHFFGDGTYQSIISPSTAFICFSGLAPGAMVVENLGFNYPPSATGSLGAVAIAFLSISPSGTASAISNVVINGANSGVLVDGCPDFVMERVFVYNYITDGVEVAGSTNVSISNCGLYGSLSSTAAIAVNWIGSGGFRVENTAINAAATGILYNYGGATQTGKLVIDGNAFEAINGAAVQLQRSGTGSLDSAVISANALHSVVVGVSVPTSSTGSWINSLAIVGNAYVGVGSAADVGFHIDTAANFTLTANTILSNSASTKAVIIGASCSNAVIQGNNLVGSFNAPSISVSPFASSIRVLDNPGYNPVGAAGLSPAASPWSYTCGISPQTIYLAATTSINTVTCGGVGILPAPTAANANFTIQLGAAETVVISYSGAMTANVMIH